MTLVILDYTLNQDVVIDAPSKNDCIEFEFQAADLKVGYSFFIPQFGMKELKLVQARKRYFKVEVHFKRPALILSGQLVAE